MRALRDGCTPLEIIDALLMAFPALGLAKLVWAAEQILVLDLPEFSPELIHAKPQWREVMRTDDIADGEVARIDCGPRSVFVYREGERFRVYDGLRLTCPKHQWQFDIRTGECITKGNHPLKAFPTKVEGGVLYALW